MQKTDNQAVLTPEQLFKKLPLSLQHKIIPPLRLSKEDRARWDSMEQSITPIGTYSGKPTASGAVRCAASVPPLTNRGGKVVTDSPDLALPSFEAKEFLKIVPLGKKGRYQQIAIPLPDKSKNAKHSFVDWVNFTFKTSNYPLVSSSQHQAITDDEYIQALSKQLFGIFGFGVIGQRENGMNFYHSAYDLGPHGWGVVCIGGQRDSVLVTIKGQGLIASKPGWEMRLFQWLQGVPGAVLTRVDLATDNFHSKTSMDDYLNMYHAGLFQSRGRAPNIEQAGNWVNPNGKGRTLYVGNRKSGKLLRIYEKGLQLANGFHEMFPNWVRVELELKNDDRVIPFEVLLRPGQYLAGAYPALANMHQIQNRIDTHKNTVKATFEKALETTRHQFGRYIWTFAEVFGVDEAFKKLTEGKEELPPRLTVAETWEQCQEGDFVHSIKPLIFETGVIPL